MDNSEVEIDLETHLNDTIKNLQGALNDTQSFLLNIINLEEIPMGQWEQGFETVSGLVDIAKELHKTVKSFKPKVKKG
jgi:hypothetical protein